MVLGFSVLRVTAGSNFQFRSQCNTPGADYEGIRRMAVLVLHARGLKVSLYDSPESVPSSLPLSLLFKEVKLDSEKTITLRRAEDAPPGNKIKPAASATMAHHHLRGLDLLSFALQARS